MEGRIRMSFEEAQTKVKEISFEAHKEKVYTSAFFVTLLTEQVGQIAEKYLHEGRYGEDIEVDITDVILVSLTYLNWLEKDASTSFKRSLEKHRIAIEIFKKQSNT
jgi:NTP pyrophosphatase (non-canonical NTP hydrolase)